MLSPLAQRAMRHPGSWLLAIALIGLLNQVFFNVYASREPQQVAALAQALPPGWFDLAPPPGWLERLTPRTPLLALTALRVQAGIELPFTMLAYLLVCRWFGADVFHRALRLRWPTSVVWTATFCLIEAWLPTPHTACDIAIRVVSGFVTAVSVGALRTPERGAKSPFTAFVVASAALGGLVLVVYDMVLLYNLGHMRADAPVAGALAVVLGLARFCAARRIGADGPATGSLIAAFGEFLVLFFIPALPIRYGFVVGLGSLAAVCGGVVVLAAVWRGRAYRRTHMAAAAAGAVSGFAAACALPARYLEIRLFLAASVFLAAALLVCWAGDRAFRRGGRRNSAR